MTKNKTVFCLDSIVYLDEEESKIKVNSKSGEIKIYRNPLGVYSTIAKAEKAISECLSDIYDYEYDNNGVLINAEHRILLVGFVLYEKHLNDSVCAWWTVRSYLPNGTLNCVSECDDGCNTPFTGRSEQVKLKVDEFALDISGYEFGKNATVCLVDNLPPMKYDKNCIKGDYSDDSYTVISTRCHTHPISPFVFPLTVEIPNSLKNKLLENRQKFNSGKWL